MHLKAVRKKKSPCHHGNYFITDSYCDIDPEEGSGLSVTAPHDSLRGTFEWPLLPGGMCCLMMYRHKKTRKLTTQSVSIHVERCKWDHHQAQIPKYDLDVSFSVHPPFSLLQRGSSSSPMATTSPWSPLQKRTQPHQCKLNPCWQAIDSYYQFYRFICHSLRESNPLAGCNRSSVSAKPIGHLWHKGVII